MNAKHLQQMMREAGCGDGAGALERALRWPLEDQCADLSAGVLKRARGEMSARAHGVWRRQVAWILALSLASMPISLALGGYATQMFYDLASVLLPASVAAYLAVTYAMIALALVGMSYAAVPVLVGRSYDRLAFARSWETMNEEVPLLR